MARLHFIGSISSEEVKNSSVSIAGNRCQIGILNGLQVDNEIVQVLSYRPNRVFPYSKKIFIPHLQQAYKEIQINFLPYINLPIIRSLLVNISALFYLVMKIKKNDSIIFYNIYLPFPLIVFFIKKIFKLKIYILACDVHKPGQTVPNSLRWHLEYLKHKIFLPKADGVIAVSEKILIDFGCKRKSIVIEGGISSDLVEINDLFQESDGVFRMLYAGALNKLNGVDILLKAFNQNQTKNLELVIAGTGELSESIKLAAKNDSRIKYKGLIEHDQLMALYSNISLLLCIRITKEIDTGYFFPSKLLEYMSTGIPILTTDVNPTTFTLNDFCCVLEQETVDGVSDGINKCINDYSELKAKANNGKIFIKNKMIWEIQGRKISEFIKL